MARRGFRKAICFFQHAFVLGTSEVSVRRENPIHGWLTPSYSLPWLLTPFSVRALEEGLHLDPLLLLKFLLQLAVLVVLMQGSRDTQVRGRKQFIKFRIRDLSFRLQRREWNPDQSRFNTIEGLKE